MSARVGKSASWRAGPSPSRRAKQCYARAMRTLLFAAAALLLATVSTTALADTLVDNANGIQVDADGRLQRFTGLVIGDDGRVDAAARAAATRGRNGRRAHRRRRADPAARADRRPRPCHGARLRRAPARPDRHDLARRPAAAAQGLCRRQSRRRAGSSGAAGTRNCGPTSASRPPPTSTRWSATGRCGSAASTAMPRSANSAALKAAGITAADQGAGGRDGSSNGLFVDAAMELVEGKVPPPDAAAYDAALAKAQELMLATGLTAAADMGTSADDWAAMNRAGRGGHAQRPHPRLCRRDPGDARDQRRQADRAGCTATGCGWSGSSSTPTARWARAGRGSRRPITTSPTRAGCSLISDAELAQADR